MGWPRTAVASGAASAVSGASNSRHQSLRAGLAALALILLAPAGAVAADMPEFLRGSYSPSYTRWDGFYVGVQGGQSSANVDFGNASASQINYILANSDLRADISSWATLPQVKTNSLSYGGFIGYNFQWGEVITGFELNYNHVAFNAAASDSLGPLKFAMQPQPDKTTI